MFVKVHKSIDTPACSNKGSCGLLANYLEKENVGKEVSERIPFFNHGYDQVSKGSAIAAIDDNIRNLTRRDAKFFMITINPSHRELQHLIQKCTGKDGVQDFTVLNRYEQQQVYVQLREYTRGVMDVYAQNFNRKNVSSGTDLKYFAKIEITRKWHAWDREVRLGKAVAGKQKEGLNLHVHVVVSRNDRTQTTKMSPDSRSRGGKQLLNGKPVEQGFNHELFKQRAGELYKERYNYHGRPKESYHSSTPVPGVSSIPGLIKAELKKELIQDHFSTEQKVIGQAKGVARLIQVSNPQGALKIATQKLLSILKGEAGLEI